MKRIITIQDISCVGKCSITVALPIISAMGIECSVMPTAVLSTHTQFKNFTFRDLTCDITPIANHFKEQKISFDAIYTGYLGSFEQLDLVSQFINDFKTKDNFVFIDPVMADNGKLYPGFNEEFALAMAKLCGKANLIVPNLTEASFMLEQPYREFGYSEEYIKDMLKRLADLGCPNVALTGVRFNENELGVMGYKAEKDEFFSYFHRYLNASFHGTGDVFSSTTCGAVVRGAALEKALALAADFTVDSLETTLNSPDHVTYGVEFEKLMPQLETRLQKIL